MRGVLEHVATWSDRSSVPVFARGRQLVTRQRFSRMLESARRHIKESGLRPGQRCALELRNPLERYLLLLAMASEGIVSVNFPPRSPAKFRSELAQRLNLTAVFLTNERDALPGIRSCKWSAADFSRSDGLFRQPREISEHEPAVVVFSDGIDGRARPVQLDALALQSRVDAALEDLQLDEYCRVLSAGTGPAGLDVALAALQGGALQIFAQASPLSEIVCRRVTHVFMGSHALNRLADEVRAAPIRLPGLKRLHTFGERLLPESFETLSRTLTENVFASYYLAEAGVIATADKTALMSSLMCRGMPQKGVEMDIRAADGAPIGPKEPGRLFVRTGTASGKYLDDDQIAGAAFDEGWIPTGMLARLSRRGRLYLDGRQAAQDARPPGKPTSGQIEHFLMQDGKVGFAVAMWLRSKDGAATLVLAVPSARDKARTQRALQRVMRGDGVARVIRVESWPTTVYGEVSLRRLKARLESAMQGTD